MSEGQGDITRLLSAWGGGDPAALDQLIPVVYQELRRRARNQLRGENAHAAVQPTELVNEVYLKLIDCSQVRWQDRAHFFAMSAQLMRRILVDLARARRAEKRGGGAIRVTFEKALDHPQTQPPDWLALDQALQALQALDERKCRIVELRFFGGLNVDETATALGVSPDTIHRDWRFAKSWLRRELSYGSEG